MQVVLLGGGKVIRHVHKSEDWTVTFTDTVQEKPGFEGLINGGFFVFRRKLQDYIEEAGSLEQEPWRKLDSDRQLAAYEDNGLRHSMDTDKDVEPPRQKWGRDIRPRVVWK